MNINRPAESGLHGLALLSSFPASLTGLGFFRSWITLLTSDGVVTGLNGPTHDLALSIVLVVLALFARCITPIFQKRWALVTCLAVALCSSTLTVGIGVTGQGPVWIGAAATVLAACASALFILLWSTLYSSLPIARTALSLALAMLLAEVVNFLLAGMTPAYRLGALAVLPCLSMACLLCARSHVPPGVGADDVLRAPSLRSVPWNLIALIAAYRFTGGFCLTVTGAPVDLYTGVANALAAGAVIVCVLYFPERVDLAAVCKSPAILLVPTLLLVPFVSGTHGALAGASAAFSSSLFGLLIFLVTCDIVRAQGIPAAFLFGIEEAAAGIGTFGCALGRHYPALAALGVSPAALTAALLALTVIAGLTLFDGEKLAARWGIRIFGPGKMAANAQENERLEATCRDAAASHGLTARELEVLLLLARGYTLNEMCEKLNVARGTVKAHCEHIYTKTGVRSKKELFKMLGVE